MVGTFTTADGGHVSCGGSLFKVDSVLLNGICFQAGAELPDLLTWLLLNPGVPGSASRPLNPQADCIELRQKLEFPLPASLKEAAKFASLTGAVWVEFSVGQW